MKNLITVFNADFEVAAFIELKDGKLATEILNREIKTDLDKALSFLAERPPVISRPVYDETGEHSAIVSSQIQESDPLYMEAMIEELKSKGIACALINPLLKDAFLLLNKEQRTREQRQEVLAEMVNIPEDEVEEFVEGFAELRSGAG